MFTKILSIATEVPKIKITQLEVINTIKKIFSKKYLQKFEKMIPVYKNSGVKQRFGCVPMDWHFKYRGWKERNSTFIKNATQLVENAIVKCLEKKSIKIKDIDDFQPHQVNKKKAVYARHLGMTKNGAPTINTKGLRIKELYKLNSENFNKKEELGVGKRIKKI